MHENIKGSPRRLPSTIAHTGLEPVVSALRGLRVNRLHQCALAKAICYDSVSGLSRLLSANVTTRQLYVLLLVEAQIFGV